MKHYVPGNAKPELVIALAAPLGSDTSLISTEITNALKAYGYVTESVRVSDLIAEWCSKPIREKLASSGEDVRINALMNAGDIIRQSVGTGAATVPLICAEIRRRRQKFLIGINCHDEYDSVELYNSCFLINSLKHPDEVDILRKVYGDKFLVVSVVSSEDSRAEFLSRKIAKSYKSPTQKKYHERSAKLISKDRQRIDTDIGQNISDTFPLADFFLRGDRHARKDVERLLEIIFGNQKVTPTRLEYAMFEARANALRSADLSRQVGAVVTTPAFDIIARGCNEVPVAGGGVYWHEDGHDKLDTRDVASGQDFNALKKIEVLKELIEFLTDEKLASLGNKNVEEIVFDLTQGDHKSSFKHLRVSNLIEFGRMVHAEMSALMEAARRGLAVQDGILVCTTFPCHMCARHIISAGVRIVYFTEPYPKSMTSEIYGDIIIIDPKIEPHEISYGCQNVYFYSFYGVAPKFFIDAFSMRKRKDKLGYAINFNKFDAQPIITTLSKSHLEVELVMSLSASLIPKISNEDDVFCDIEATS